VEVVNEFIGVSIRLFLLEIQKEMSLQMTNWILICGGFQFNAICMAKALILPLGAISVMMIARVNDFHQNHAGDYRMEVQQLMSIFFAPFHLRVFIFSFCQNIKTTSTNFRRVKFESDPHFHLQAPEMQDTLLLLRNAWVQ